MIRRTVLWHWLLVSMLVLLTPLAAAAKGADSEKDPQEKAEQKADDKGEEKAAPADDDEAKKDEKTEPESKKYKAGVMLESITGFDPSKGTYSAEFVVFIHCDHECKPEVDAVNAKTPLSKPEKLVDDKDFKVYKYKAELNAVVDMGMFPFDEHVLPLILEDRADPTAKWELDNDTTGFDKEKVKLPGFATTAWDAKVVSDDIGGGHKVDQLALGLQVKRMKFAGFVSNLLPPLVMALFVMGATLFMKAKTAQGRLGGVTGSLLALVMFHKGALPPGGVLTLLDKFMIATYLIYVVNILCSVVMLRMDDTKREKNAELAYLAAWGLVPGFALVAWVAVFLKLV